MMKLLSLDLVTYGVVSMDAIFVCLFADIASYRLYAALSWCISCVYESFLHLYFMLIWPCFMS